jgi:hypothetical protein
LKGKIHSIPQTGIIEEGQKVVNVSDPSPRMIIKNAPLNQENSINGSLTEEIDKWVIEVIDMKMMLQITISLV